MEMIEDLRSGKFLEKEKRDKNKSKKRKMKLLRRRKGKTQSQSKREEMRVSETSKVTSEMQGKKLERSEEEKAANITPLELNL